MTSAGGHANIVLCGLGRWGQNLLRTLNSQGHLYGVYDPVAAALAKAPVTAVQYNTYESVLADPSVHCVVLATPIATHVPLCRQALLAGKHVYVEKPLATTTKDAQALMDLAQEKRLQVFVGHLMLYHDSFRECAHAVRESGKAVEAIFFERGAHGPFFGAGHVIWDLGPHDVSMLYNLLPGYTMTVTAVSGTPDDLDVAVCAQLNKHRVLVRLRWSRWFVKKHSNVTIVTAKKTFYFDDTQSQVIDKAFYFEKGCPQEKHFLVSSLPWQSPLENEIESLVAVLEGTQGWGNVTNGSTAIPVVHLLEMIEKMCPPVAWPQAPVRCI